MFQTESAKLGRTEDDAPLSFPDNPHFLKNGIDDWFLYVVTFLLGNDVHLI
jgi:hypothetical protein